MTVKKLRPVKVGAYAPTVLGKRVVCTMRNGIPIIVGTILPTVTRFAEFVVFQHPTFGPIESSLIKVTNNAVWYRQVMKPAARNDAGGRVQFRPEQQ